MAKDELRILGGVDLSAKLARTRYKERMPDLEIRLGALQRRAIEAGLPVLVSFEGWEAAGKGTLINRLIHTLDPRHFKVFPIGAPTEEERLHPHLWRFWMRLPAAGKMSILDRSWYRRVLGDRVDKKANRDEWERAYDEIASFERQLADGGYLLIKLFLHISQKEQKKRFVKLEGDPATAWRIGKADWVHHKHYEAWGRAAEEMLGRSNHAHAPWRVIAAHDRRLATVTMFETVCGAIEDALAARATHAADTGAKTPRARSEKSPKQNPLDRVDLTQRVTRDEYDRKLGRYQKQMRALEHEVYSHRVPVIVAYEGWDAAGKGGNIKRLTQSMDPRGYEVIPIGAPSDLERRHHYLWRFWKAIPKGGHVAIFDRTWYGRVLVERVEGLCTEAQWRRAYREINEMEAQLVDSGAVLVKFWLHIDREEQLRRFEERRATAYKNWKITDEDWRNRERWDDYRAAVEDMITHTSTVRAPWTVVPSNSKHFARLEALRTVIAAVRRRLS